MLTITVEGDRGEGKSMLAGTLEYLLDSLTNFTVSEFEEEGCSKEAERSLLKWRATIDMKFLRQLEARPVKIVVKNSTSKLSPGHLYYGAITGG